MLYAFDDPKFWGKQFKMAAGRLGRECQLFRNVASVPPGARAFVRLDQEGAQREQSKQLVDALHSRRVITLPNISDSISYDDKVIQSVLLYDWLPPTFIFRNDNDAFHFLHTGVDRNIFNGLDYPFISKAADSSASKAVRLIHSQEQARGEINAVFNGAGIPSAYDRVQKGYLYWQKFMPGNTCDYRIVVMHNKVMGLIRFNRMDKDRPFASGSGDHIPILDFTDELAYRAARICLIASKKLKTNWMAYDVVFDGAANPYILEMSSSWTPYSYTKCPLFSISPLDGNEFFFNKTYDNGAHMFECAVEALLELPPL